MENNFTKLWAMQALNKHFEKKTLREGTHDLQVKLQQL